MAKAYFINGTPTNVKIILNQGTQNSLNPMSVAPDGKSVSGPAWAAEIKSTKGQNVFGGNNDDNELLYSSEQSGKTARYSIKSSVSTVLDLYFFMFEDTIVGEDQTGDSSKITIKRIETLNKEL